VPLESEEDLMYFTGEHSVPLRNNEIMKMTEFKATEKGLGEEKEMERVHVRLKPWEREVH
jgi:hypothetical protein